MIKILIADDHAIVRRGLKEILEEQPGMRVAGEAGNAQDVLEFLRGQSCDLVVLDLVMPGKNGLDLVKAIKEGYPRLPVLVLSVHPEDQFAVRALKAGASGYMTKESAPEELVKAVRKVVAGGKYVSPSLAERLAFEVESGSTDVPHKALSDREYQVLCRIGSGKTITEIGNELSLSPKTISSYRARILNKMQMKTTAQLTHYAIKNGLVT